MKDLRIWPYPAQYSETASGQTIEFNGVDWTLFDVKTSQYVKDDVFVVDMMKRYTSYFQKVFYDTSRDVLKVTKNLVTFPQDSPLKLSLIVADVSQRELSLKTIERYNLTVKSDGSAAIEAVSIFGLLRGVESLSQLVVDRRIAHTPIRVADEPRYPWRGVMIDVSRHFLQLSTLRTLIDAMAVNKFNKLHLHLTDAESFPVVNPDYPQLHQKGAYHPSRAVYTEDDLRGLASYGYLRGVEVYPEVDLPGHCFSFGKGYPETVAQCPSYSHNIDNVPLNPLSAQTADVVGSVVGRLGDVFGQFTEFFHTGGDELVYECWQEDKNISAYMRKTGLSGSELNSVFMEDAVYKKALAPRKLRNVVWQERAQEKKVHPLPDGSVVQNWRLLKDLKSVSETGLPFINSAGWYVDQLIPVPPNQHYLMLDTFFDMIGFEMDDFVEAKFWPNNLGGEAPQWGEQINDHCVFERLFPKACAAAERLWSPKFVKFERSKKAPKGITPKLTISEETIISRIKAHLCHMLQRGIPVSSFRPDYCPEVEL